MAREREGDGGAQPFSGMKKGVRADSVRMAHLLCGFGSLIVRFGSTNVMSYITTPDKAAKLFRGNLPQRTLTMLSKRPCVKTFVQSVTTFTQKPSTPCRKVPDGSNSGTP